MNSICVLCNNDILEKNNTNEHIIPNSIGGRKKVKGFICNTCNNKYGHIWDNALAEQLNPLSLFFKISRERGTPPSQVFDLTNGSQLKLNADGSLNYPKPLYHEENHGDRVEINFQVRTKKETKKMLQGIKRKYPSVDIDNILENFDIKSSYCSDMMQFELNFGGNNSGRSIIKAALALIYDSGIDPKICHYAVDYLINGNSEPCFGYYYERDLIINRPNGIPLHCLSVIGNSVTGLVLGYIEYFGVQRLVACLSNNYNGESFNNTYSLDPISGSELDIEVDINLTYLEVKDAYDYKKFSYDNLNNAFYEVFRAQMKKDSKQERERVIKLALENAVAKNNLKEGDEISPEQARKMAVTITDELIPLLIHQLGIK